MSAFLLTSEAAKAQIRKVMPRGTNVYVITLSVSKSGMSRRMRFLVAIKRGHIQDVTGWVCRAGIFSGDIDRGALVSGVGMDMHRHTVERIAHALGYDMGTWGEDSPLVKRSL